ncbi:MAG TPA: hypothetical protein VFV46_05240 [Lacibacter sp.]|nr:hypothetical protein [Lacibacter sp.]
MRILRFTSIIIVTAALLGSCKKFNAAPTYAGASLARIWAKQEAFYRPKAEIFIDSTNTWRSFIGFSLTSDAEPDKLGFANPYVAGKGTNALYMNVIYDRLENLTSDSGYYNVTIPKCFQFIPKSPGAKEGIVKVLEQKVKMYRVNKTSFEIGIKGSGTYSEITQQFEVEVIFDESSIGRPTDTKRKYRFAP